MLGAGPRILCLVPNRSSPGVLHFILTLLRSFVFPKLVFAQPHGVVFSLSFVEASLVYVILLVSGFSVICCFSFCLCSSHWCGTCSVLLLEALAPRWLFSFFVHTPPPPRWCGTCSVLLSVFVSPPVAIQFICAHPRWLFSLFVHTPRWCGTCSVLLSELLGSWWLFSLFVHTPRRCGTCSVLLSVFVSPPVAIQFICAHPPMVWHLQRIVV